MRANKINNSNNGFDYLMTFIPEDELNYMLEYFDNDNINIRDLFEIQDFSIFNEIQEQDVEFTIDFLQGYDSWTTYLMVIKTRDEFIRTIEVSTEEGRLHGVFDYGLICNLLEQTNPVFCLITSKS